MLQVDGHDVLTSSDIAELIKVQPRTIQRHLEVSRARRRAGDIRPGDMPEPDGKALGRNYWRPATVERWLAGRPGRGVGGGRKGERDAQPSRAWVTATGLKAGMIVRRPNHHTLGEWLTVTRVRRNRGNSSTYAIQGVLLSDGRAVADWASEPSTRFELYQSESDTRNDQQ